MGGSTTSLPGESLREVHQEFDPGGLCLYTKTPMVGMKLTPFDGGERWLSS